MIGDRCQVTHRPEAEEYDGELYDLRRRRAGPALPAGGLEVQHQQVRQLLLGGSTEALM